MNSTTWAILNNEKNHGITLHYINSSIDCGDIALQSRVEISSDETAFSLNLKCSEALLLLFQKAINRITNRTLPVIEQDLSGRTYYSRSYIPENYAIINGITDLNDLSRLIRGLSFGNGYTNPVASVKIILNDRFYIVEDFNIRIDRNAPDNDSVIFATVKDIYGNKTDTIIKYNDLLLPYRLGRDDLMYLSNIKAKEHKNKRQIEKFIDAADALIAVLDHLPLANDYSDDYVEKIGIPDYIDVNHALTIVYIVLARFFNQNFIISLYNFDETIPSDLFNLVENRSLILVDKEMLSYTFNQLADFLIKQQTNSNTIVKDFGYRYNLSLQTDIAISSNVEDMYIDQHKMLIYFDKHEIAIKGSSFYELQIKSICRCIKTLFKQYINNKLINDDLRKIKILSDAEFNKIVYKWNQTEKSYAENTTIHELFEEQVQRTPDNIAVVYENTKLTYMEVNQRANQLAHYLRQTHNIKGDDLLVLCLDRSEYMLIAILAVLKSGAAYVPVDPGYPEERIKYILKDTQTRVLITNNYYSQLIMDVFSRYDQDEGNYSVLIETILIDKPEFNQILKKKPISNPDININTSNLAYVIYTSGTTGQPKGVMIEHKSLVLFISGMRFKLKNYNLHTFNTLSTTNYVFDIFGLEYLLPLTSGSSVELYDLLRENNALINLPNYNFIQLTPSKFGLLIQRFNRTFNIIDGLHSITLLIGGESFTDQIKQEVSKLEEAFEYKIKFNVINIYGPTESTIWSLAKFIDKGAAISIGKPLNNTKAYILDTNLNLLPVGSIGELYIGGACLARGYLNQPDLTQERFIANPFQSEEEKKLNSNARLYKTGDLVSYFPDGNIEHIGRNDFQVKIRGHRIELGEIEAKLSVYQGVKQAVVLAREHLKLSDETNKYLTGYYIADAKLNEDDILRYLSLELPEYMVPGVLVWLDKLPLTINGKLDRKALPDPEFISESRYVAPRDELEVQICEIYAQILSLPLDQVGIKDDFFLLGGNSILAIKLVGRLNKTLMDTKTILIKQISVTDIFKHKTIISLLDMLISEDDSEVVIIPKLSQSKSVNNKLSPAQEHLWLIGNYKNCSNAYNIPLFVTLREDVDFKLLKQSLHSVINRHEVLHSLIKTDDEGNSYQEAADLSRFLPDIRL